MSRAPGMLTNSCALVALVQSLVHIDESNIRCSERVRAFECVPFSTVLPAILALLHRNILHVRALEYEMDYASVFVSANACVRARVELVYARGHT